MVNSELEAERVRCLLAITRATPGDRNWKSLLSRMRERRRPVPESIGSVISHHDVICELERLIVTDMRQGTLGRVAEFLSGVLPRPWIADSATGTVIAGQGTEGMDQEWYSYDRTRGRIRYLTDADWLLCAAEAGELWGAAGT
jgi:hypothetical protein